MVIKILSFAFIGIVVSARTFNDEYRHDEFSQHSINDLENSYTNQLNDLCDPLMNYYCSDINKLLTECRATRDSLEAQLVESQQRLENCSQDESKIQFSYCAESLPVNGESSIATSGDGNETETEDEAVETPHFVRKPKDSDAEIGNHHGDSKDLSNLKLSFSGKISGYIYGVPGANPDPKDESAGQEIQFEEV